MNDYGKGSVLGAVTILPATAVGGMLLVGKGNPWIIAGMTGISLISLVFLIAFIRRYLKNIKV